MKTVPRNSSSTTVTHVQRHRQFGGVDKVAFTKGVAAADYDKDGYMDLYASNLAGDNFLYHNNHDGTFTEIARLAGVPGSGRGFATWFFDYDNDGWPICLSPVISCRLKKPRKRISGCPTMRQR